METHGRSKTKSKRKREASSSKTSQSRSRSRRKSDDDDDDSYDSETDSRGSLTPSHHRSHKRSLSRRSASRDSDDSDDGSDLERKRKRSSSKKVTDEDIADYLAKKAQKKALKVAKKLKSQTVSGYSNDANPFGDSNLNEKFVWRKKIEKDISHGVPLDMFSIKAEKKKQRERMAEIEKVKKRREERAIEKAQHEEEMALLARERARAEFQDWEKKEEEFHFDQSKVRSEIRLREGRTKPIDILSKQLNPLDDFDIEINEPYMVLKGLTVREMEELREDIKMHLDLDRATPTHIEYWEELKYKLFGRYSTLGPGSKVSYKALLNDNLLEGRVPEELYSVGVHGGSIEDPHLQIFGTMNKRGNTTIGHFYFPSKLHSGHNG